MVIGVATGKAKATNKPWEDNWVFAITVRNGKLTNIREYVDTQALAHASVRVGRERKYLTLRHGLQKALTSARQWNVDVVAGPE
jgi:hypothetical protein